MTEQMVRCPKDAENKLFCGRCRQWIDSTHAEQHVKTCWSQSVAPQAAPEATESQKPAPENSDGAWRLFAPAPAEEIDFTDCVCTCGHYGHFQDGAAGCTTPKCGCYKYEPDFKSEATRQHKEKLAAALGKQAQEIVDDSELWYDLVRDIARETIGKAYAQKRAAELYNQQSHTHCDIRAKYIKPATKPEVK